MVEVDSLEYFGGVPKTVLTDQMSSSAWAMIGSRDGIPCLKYFAAAIGLIPRFAAYGGPKRKEKSNEAFNSSSRILCRAGSSRI
jgi:transposase